MMSTLSPQSLSETQMGGRRGRRSRRMGTRSMYSRQGQGQGQGQGQRQGDGRGQGQGQGLRQGQGQ